jgi:hypothetical protein
MARREGAPEFEVVVCVFVQNAGHGGEVAAPVARTVLEAYFAGTNPQV